MSPMLSDYQIFNYKNVTNFVRLSILLLIECRQFCLIIKPFSVRMSLILLDYPIFHFKNVTNFVRLSNLLLLEFKFVCSFDIR